jgi:putative two-component system response regulator
VAYEHHIKLDGGGYPTLRHPRKCHQASDLVHVCDVFDALRTDRPYREAWPTSRALSLIGEGAGQEFDPDLSHAFTQMIDQWETRIAELEDEDEALPLGIEALMSGYGEGSDAPVPDSGVDSELDEGIGPGNIRE